MSRYACWGWGIVIVAAAGTLLGPRPAAGEEPMTASNQASEVTVEKIPEMTVLVLPMTGTYDQHGQAIQQVVMHAMTTGIIRGAPFAVYHNHPEQVPVDSLRWDVCVPVALEAKAEPPFVVQKLPAVEAAVVTCTGPYEGTGPCYGVLTAWLAQSGRTLDGSPREHWLSDARSVPPEKCVARIVFPIAGTQP